jgi:glycosyltransferase involved in cell wall biosynthesis
VTQEHLALWERRLGRPLHALLLPSTVEAARFKFNARQRDRIRSELGVRDKWVLVYSGSVSLSWQRFECVCQLVQRLVAAGQPAFLLALVHPDGHATAQKLMVQHGLESCAVLRAVHPQEMGEWLSAADVGLFLRHNHMMNRVVTSAKLGEYLAAGLPLITTWGCPYFRAFAETHSAAVVLPDSLEWPRDFPAQVELLVARGKDDTWRAHFSEAFERTFAGKDNPIRDYVQFIANLLR